MLALQNTELGYMLLGATACLLLLFVMLSIGRNNRLLQKSLEQQRELNTSLLTSIELLTERSKDFQHEYQKLQADIVVNDLYKNGAGSYQQAISAAKSGSSAEEIAKSYELNVGEAELLVSIHGKRLSVT